jgi:hypothetical protein
MRNVFLKFIFIYIFFVIFNFFCFNFLFAKEINQKKEVKIDAVFWSKRQVELSILLQKKLAGTPYEFDSCSYMYSNFYYCYIVLKLDEIPLGK